MLTPNTTLGAYRLIQPIGAGGMGEVWKAEDTRLGRVVAIKILPPSIATIHAIEEADGRLFIAMEFVDGEPLAKLIKRGLSEAEICRIGRSVANALAEAHAKGIIHRDIKPHPRADIFSLRVVLYEAATGQLPFKGETVTETMTQIIRDEPKEPVRALEAPTVKATVEAPPRRSSLTWIWITAAVFVGVVGVAMLARHRVAAGPPAGRVPAGEPAPTQTAKQHFQTAEAALLQRRWPGDPDFERIHAEFREGRRLRQ